MSSWKNYGPPPSISVGSATAVTEVQRVMGALDAKIASFTAQAEAVFAGLQNITVESTTELPALTIPSDVAALEWNTQGIAAGALGDVTLTAPSEPSLPSIETGLTITAPTFSPSITSISLPQPPAGIDVSGLPRRPAIDTSVDLPQVPQLSLPTLEDFAAINIPVFTFPTINSFDVDAPEFTGARPSMHIQWDEPAYTSENFDAVRAVIERIFAGGTGLPPVIEQQMFDRARAREDQTAAKAVGEAFDTFASKGFTMPPGMLVEQVNAVLRQNQLAANALQREILLKVADVEIENMKFAVQQGLAAENILFSIFNNAAQRAFEIAKYAVEANLQLYQVEVSLFNAFMSAYQTKAQVYKIRLDAQLSALEAYKVALEGQKVISEINAQKVTVFGARIQALLTQVEVYKATMEGARIKSEVVRTQIEAFKADVQAYAEGIGAQKTVFDAYRVQVEGEVAKVGIIDAEARVFQTLMSAEEIKSNVQVKGIQAKIELMQATTQRFASQVDLAKTQLQAKVASVEAKAREAGLNIQFMAAQSDANRAKAEATIRIGEQRLQTNIAVANTQIKRYEILINKALQEAELKSRSLQAAGQMASTLAGGAMAAQHVGATIASSASDSTATNYSTGETASEQWNYSTTVPK